jgi:FkbM family methyltransferase
MQFLKKIINFLLHGRFDSFLMNSEGVIHIGANVGQEKDHYKNLGVKRVVWIEADPEIFKILLTNIKKYRNNKAYNFLVTEKNNQKYTFNISNNAGNSSSIFELNQHKKIYPDVKYNKKIILIGKTLKEIIFKKKINLNHFKILVLDVQGAELKVLQGAKYLLNKFNYIKLETSEFDLYRGNPLHSEISEYLYKFGFKEKKKIIIGKNNCGQKAYDVLYRNSSFN